MNNNESKLTRGELLDHLRDLIKLYDDRPQGVLMSPVTHGELHSILLLLYALLRGED
jgi:hypothetical protein